MSAPTQANAEKKLVMVVEDDPSVRALIVKALSPSYRVVEADDGLSASEKLAELRPDLLICDVMMPRIDGFSLAKLIRSKDELSAVPIIFLTAKTAPASIVQGIQLGAKHYIQKPFQVKDLLDKVRKLLA